MLPEVVKTILYIWSVESLVFIGQRRQEAGAEILRQFNTKICKQVVDVNSSSTMSNGSVFHSHPHWPVVLVDVLILRYCLYFTVDVSKSRVYMPGSACCWWWWLSWGMDKVDVIIHKRYEFFSLMKRCFLDKSNVLLSIHYLLWIPKVFISFF